MNALEATYAELADRFVADFPASVAYPRTIGRELEFPVVNATGQAGDVRRVLARLAAEGDLQVHTDPGAQNMVVALDGSDYNYELEVGVGTVEVVTRPCHSLQEMERIVRTAVDRLVRAAATFGWQLLGYGIQPVTPPTLPLMAPKQRYNSLYRVMGAEWLWYTVTASDQCHVAIARDEVIPLLNFGNLMTPVLIALCANSPIYTGKLSPFCSGREGEMALIHAQEFRHGMPARPFVDAKDFVRSTAQATHLIHRVQNMVIPQSRPFAAYLQEHGADYDAFLFHEHYIWNSARVRPTYGTIELRPACQQPWPEQMAAMALGVGLIEAATAINDYVQTTLGRDYWSILRTYHKQVIVHGLAAPQPAPAFLQQVVLLAEQGLRSRGQAEEAFLRPIFDRIYRRQNPAQRVHQAFQVDGLAGLLRQTAIRPELVR